MSDIYLNSLIQMFENLEGIGNLVKLKLHNVKYGHECLDTRFLAKWSIQFRLQAGCKISIDIKDRLIYNEQTTTWNKIVEHTDLIIIRNSMLQTKLNQIIAQQNGHRYELKHKQNKSPKRRHTNKNKDNDGKLHDNLLPHHFMMRLSTSCDDTPTHTDNEMSIGRINSFGKYFISAISDTELRQSSDSEDTLTSSRKHAGILHKHTTM